MNQRRLPFTPFRQPVKVCRQTYHTVHGPEPLRMREMILSSSCPVCHHILLAHDLNAVCAACNLGRVMP